MHRTIWIYYFVTGLLSLSAGLPAIDNWATALIPHLDGVSCRLLEPGIALSRPVFSLCLAAGFNELRGLAGAGLDALLHVHGGMKLAEWLHLADVLVIMLGTAAAAIALLWVWAHGMTRLAAISMTGTYTLVRAMGLALDRHGYRA